MVRRRRLPELPEEEMAPGRWHGASISAPRRSKSRQELKQVIPAALLASCRGMQIRSAQIILHLFQPRQAD